MEAGSVAGSSSLSPRAPPKALGQCARFLSGVFEDPFEDADVDVDTNTASSQMATFLEMLRDQRAKVERMKKDRIKKKRAALKQRLGHDSGANDLPFMLQRRETVEVLHRRGRTPQQQEEDALGGDLGNLSLPYVTGHSEPSLLSGRSVGGGGGGADALHSRSDEGEGGAYAKKGGLLSEGSPRSPVQPVAFQVSSVCHPLNANKPVAASKRECLKVELVQEAVDEIVRQTLETERYDAAKARRWCHVICERAVEELQGKVGGFKLIANCVIVPRKGQGLAVRSGSKWDRHRDGAVTIRRDSRTMHAVVTVWGLHTNKSRA